MYIRSCKLCNLYFKLYNVQVNGGWKKLVGFAIVYFTRDRLAVYVIKNLNFNTRLVLCCVVALL